MPWPRPSQVSSNDGSARDNGLSAEDDVLRARDGRPTGHFVPGILDVRTYGQSPPHGDIEMRPFTYRLDVLRTRVVYWKVHGSSEQACKMYSA